MSGPYFPSLKGPFERHSTSTPNRGADISGSGSPEGRIIGWPGCTYCDTAANVQYLKVQGTQAFGWASSGGGCTVSSGTSGGTASIYYGTGSPDGVVVAARPAIYYDDSGGIWLKENSTNDADGWVQRIG